MTRRPPPPREYLAAVPRYVPGTAAARRDGSAGYKLSSNESPYPLAEEMVGAMLEEAQRANRYPPDGRVLARRIAARHAVPEEMVAVSGGSLGLLRDLLTAYAGHAAEVVFGWRSYEAYPILVQSLGARPVPVPLTDYRIDLDGLAAAVTSDTRMVLLANPNNPTGTVVDQDDLERFAKALPEDCLLALDEAYCEYSGEELGVRGIALAKSLPNVVVLRTFSKAYALAGMRIGWCVADPEIVDSLGLVSLPFTLTTMAQAAALAALDNEDLLFEQVRKTIAERELVQTRLKEAGLPTPPSEANFVWLPLGSGSQQFANSCGEAGISVRCFAGDGVRVTIGAPIENDAFLAVVSGYGTPASPPDRKG
jgi:histidinol-phosphate aminotransferase